MEIENVNINPLRIGHLTVKLPIIQGGMGIGISLSSLASAVANEGGVGTISAAGIGLLEGHSATDYLEASIRGLKREIRKAREMTRGILGVNIMVAQSNFADMVKTSISEGIDVIFSGAGLPLNLPQFLEGTSKTKLVPIISSAKAAGLIARRWLDKFNYLPDAFVVEGPLAGGHLGFKEEQIAQPEYALEKLVPEVITEVETLGRPIPVIAAGGIYSGADIRKFINLGAAGVQMATRFVTTDECDASLSFKQAYLKAKKEDMVIIKSPVGMPARAISNKFINDVNGGAKKPVKCPYHCIKTCDYRKSPYCIAFVLLNAQKGNLMHGFAFAGENAYRAKEIIPVKKLVESLLLEYGMAGIEAGRLV